jgi:hypothetical protein
MENSFRSIIESAGSIVIFLPTTSYLDQVASALSLFLALKDSKTVQIVSASPITVLLNRLIGVDKISDETGNKNLVIGFSDYDANGIEKVSYDIVENQFKLTVIPKSGVNPPKENQVKVAYEGISADTVILFGGATDAHFPQLATKGLESAKMYHIGTRPLTVDPSKVIYTFAQPMASVAELTFFLLNEAQLPINADVATNLLMGIEDATQNYKSQTVTAETFEITASLIRMGGRRLSGEPVVKTKYPVGSIPQTVKPAPVVEDKAGSQAVSQTDYADFSQKQQDQPKEATPVTTTEDITEDVSEDILNPPDDWLQPKVYRGTSLN